MQLLRRTLLNSNFSKHVCRSIVDESLSQDTKLSFLAMIEYVICYILYYRNVFVVLTYEFRVPRFEFRVFIYDVRVTLNKLHFL